MYCTYGKNPSINLAHFQFAQIDVLIFHTIFERNKSKNAFLYYLERMNRRYVKCVVAKKGRDFVISFPVYVSPTNRLSTKKGVNVDL